MNDLIRPTLYEAYHGVRPVVLPAADTPASRAMWLDRSAKLAIIWRWIGKWRHPSRAIFWRSVLPGAYGATQSSTYKHAPADSEVLVKGDQFHVIRPRGTYEELLGLDSIPGWLA